MERTEIDGVSVVWEETEGPLQAELAFACGHRDEQLDTFGLTDLLQHLVDPDGTTTHFSTSFYATTTGSPPTSSAPTRRATSPAATPCSP